MKKVAIIGAGLSGLAAGEILSKYFEVDIFEKDSNMGGLAKNFRKDNRNIPIYYHHVIRSNKNTLKYLEEFAAVDIEKLKWQRIKVAIALDKGIFNINDPFRFMRFSYLSLYEKIRFGFFGLYTLFLMDPEKIKDGQDAEKWLTRLAGKEVTRKIFYHLYARNKFNIPLSKISAKQFAYRLNEKEVYDQFTFPEKGYQKMIDNMATSIRGNQGSIKTEARITSIDVQKKEITINGTKRKYDIIINTAPFPEFLDMASNLPQELAKNLSKIRYCPAIGVCFATEDFLDKRHYWINFFNERIHMLIQHSVLNDSYKGKINWCLRYGGSEEDLNLSDKEIEGAYLGVVKRYFPRTRIKWARVFRTKYGEPIYDINYKKYMPDYRSQLGGLYFAGIQLTYPKIRTMNVAIGSGRKVAQLILKDHLNKA